MPLPTKTLSPAELAKLEHAFATDPASDAYKPLAEAYLGMGRFMEAMVVCKKGVKAHPTAADARILLARVYADQGKDKKALEELVGAVAVAPNDKGVLRMMGALQVKTGEVEPGKANLLKAFEADPNDAETIAALQQAKIEVPKPAPVPVAVPVAAPPVLEAAPARPATGPQAPVARAAVAGAPQPIAQRPKPAPRPSQTYDDDEPNSVVSEVSELSNRRGAKKGSGTARALFAVLLIGLPVGVGVYFGVTNYNAKRAREVKRQIGRAHV